MGFLIDFVNLLIEKFVSVSNIIFGILPDSPFKNLSNQLDKTFLGYINWVLPVAEMIEILALWAAAVAIYYTVSNILRLVKSIE